MADARHFKVGAPSCFFFISNFRRVLNVVCVLLGNSLVSDFYMPTFRNTVFHLHSGQILKNACPPMNMEQSVPKRRHIEFRRCGITQKEACNIFLLQTAQKCVVSMSLPYRILLYSRRETNHNSIPEEIKRRLRSEKACYHSVILVILLVISVIILQKIIIP